MELAFTLTATPCKLQGDTFIFNVEVLLVQYRKRVIGYGVQIKAWFYECDENCNKGKLNIQCANFTEMYRYVPKFSMEIGKGTSSTCSLDIQI